MILITGHMGFIGKHLTRMLDKKDIPWIGFDLLNKNKDIRNKFELDKIFSENHIDTVVHLAARAGVRKSKEYPEEYISTNIQGTQNIVEMCDKHKARLIFFSSSSVYGDVKKLPTKEDNEKSPLSLYGITKLAGEHIVNNMLMPHTIIRPFTVYGENGRKDEVVYKWLEQIKAGKPITVYGDGSSCRGYVYVNDLVEAVIVLATCDWAWNGEDFNLGGSEVIYLKDLVDLFKEEFNNLEIEELPKQDEDVYQQYTSVKKAESFLDFKPEKRFVGNVKNIIKNFKNKYEK